MRRKKRRFNLLNFLLFRRKKETIYIKKNLDYQFVLNKDSKQFENKTIWPFAASLKPDQEKTIDTSKAKKDTSPIQLNLLDPKDLKLKNDLQKEKLLEKKEDIKTLNKITNLEYSKTNEKIDSSLELSHNDMNNIDSNDLFSLIYEIVYNKDINNKEESKEDIEIVKDYTKELEDTQKVDDNLEEISNSIDEEKNKLGLNDIEFEILKDEYVDIEKLNTYISKFLSYQQNEIENITKKVENNQAQIEKSTKLVQQKVTSIHKVLLGTSLLMSTPMIPRTIGGRFLRLGMIFFGLHSLTTATRLETKTTYKTTVTYKNYESVIKEGINDLNSVSDDIDLAMDNIKNLKIDFQQYKDYSEYNSIMKTLDELEHKLLIEYQVLKEYNDKLNKSLAKNNIKVKKIDEI